MKERVFIEKNKDKWLRFEELFKAKKKNPEELSTLFVQITDDLSYARTYYPNRSVRVYLNRLASSVFLSIYTQKKTKWERLKTFWTSELPKIIYESRKEMLFSLLVFVLSVAIGVWCTHHDPEFARTILSDHYVDMTLTNIENNDPMAVYKSRNALTMFLGITINNVKVAFLTFVSGIVFLVGSIGILLRNGIMLGTFQYFFVQQDLLGESALSIWMHGTIEILSIIVAGGAGMVMGSGWVFPGTLTRWQAFQLSAKRGVKIMIGIVPLFIIAGFIEGFITRHTEVPDGVRLFFILVCLGFMLFYFVYLPYKHRFQPESLSGVERLEADIPVALHRDAALTNTNVIAHTFGIILPHFMRWFVTLSLLNVVVSYLLTQVATDQLSVGPFSAHNIASYTVNILWGDETSALVRIIHIATFTLAALLCSPQIQRAYGGRATFLSELVSPLMLRILLFFTLFFSLFSVEDNTAVFLGVLIVPLIYLLLVPAHYDEGPERMSLLWRRFGKALLQQYMMSFISFFVGALVWWIATVYVFDLVSTHVMSLFYTHDDDFFTLHLFFSAMMTHYVLFFVVVFHHIVSTLTFISEKEKFEGRGLKNKLKELFS